MLFPSSPIYYASYIYFLKVVLILQQNTIWNECYTSPPPRYSFDNISMALYFVIIEVIDSRAKKQTANDHKSEQSLYFNSNSTLAVNYR